MNRFGPQRSHRLVGALLGSVVGDALGAPFEFGPPGQLSARFPVPARGVRTEMCGGGVLGWEPGEFTDDTQMALLVAESLLEQDGLDEADVFARFQQWVAANPPDVGIQTGAVLRSGLPWDRAAAVMFERDGRGAGNGSLMRATPSAIFFSRSGRDVTMAAARRISALTHGDPAAGEGVAIFHELVRAALEGTDPLEVVEETLSFVAPEHRRRWSTVLSPDWTPDLATEPNGAVWPTLGTALWALRSTDSFEGALRAVVDVGGDTDTVAAVTGGLVGAVYGEAAIPIRWGSVVHGTVPGFPGSWGRDDLLTLAYRLDGRRFGSYVVGESEGLDPVEVFPGVWASDYTGARRSDPELAVFSLCRTGPAFGHRVQRFAFLEDDDSNPELDRVLDDVVEDMRALHAEGVPLLVHCHQGRSRTGLVLRAWLRRTEGLSSESATAEVARRWPHLSTWNADFDDALERVV